MVHHENLCAYVGNKHHIPIAIPYSGCANVRFDQLHLQRNMIKFKIKFKLIFIGLMLNVVSSSCYPIQ